MTEGKCAIWGTPATIVEGNGPPEYDSPRAGGKYLIGLSSIRSFPTQDQEFKLKLTSWLVEQRCSGKERPEISASSDFIEYIKARNFLSTSERINNFFKWCLDSRVRPGNNTLYSNMSLSLHDGSELRLKMADTVLSAVTESENSDEFYALCSLMKELGYLTEQDKISALGFQKIEDLESINANSKQAFVAMWFDGKMDDIYANGILPAIEGENFKPVRIDREHHTKNIIDFMIGEIKRSKFVVADFTSMILKDGDNRDRQVDIGGVYFEAGYALGLNIPVIWTCHKDHSGSIHFDLKQFNTIFYTDPDDLKHQLSTRIRAMFVS